MAAIVDGIYYGCKTKYVEKCVKHGIKIIYFLGTALFVHPWGMPMGGRQSKYWLPWLVGMPAETATAIVSVLMGGILEQFPKLRFCFAHGGGSFPFTIGRIEHGYHVRMIF